MKKVEYFLKHQNNQDQSKVVFCFPEENRSKLIICVQTAEYVQ